MCRTQEAPARGRVGVTLSENVAKENISGYMACGRVEGGGVAACCKMVVRS